MSSGLSGDEGRAVRIRVEHVAKTYTTGLWPLVRHNEVLTDASMEVGAGEIAAIVGANGSGKSTLMTIIAGVLEPDGGQVYRNGGLGYCPQQPVLYDRLTVEETFRLFGVAYGMDDKLLARRKGELMDALEFGGYHDYRVEHLSGGSRQKLNLAVALLHDPEVLLLDEPYSGFDYETYLRFWEIAEELAGRGKSILIVSHFVEDEGRFDRIYRVRDGGCVEETEDGEGTVEEAGERGDDDRR
jgi:ABC-type multidrug transport system ATPase subunit